MTSHTCSSSKRIRLTHPHDVDAGSTSSSAWRLTEKVLCGKDYLNKIYEYLTIPQIMKSIPTISIFHSDHINSDETLRILKKILSYDFGDILNLFKITLVGTQNNDTSDQASNCQQIARFYTDWQYLQDNAIAAELINEAEIMVDGRRYRNFKALALLEPNECLQYWIDKVLFLCGFIFVFFFSRHLVIVQG